MRAGKFVLCASELHGRLLAVRDEMLELCDSGVGAMTMNEVDLAVGAADAALRLLSLAIEGAAGKEYTP